MKSVSPEAVSSKYAAWVVRQGEGIMIRSELLLSLVMYNLLFVILGLLSIFYGVYYQIGILPRTFFLMLGIIFFIVAIFGYTRIIKLKFG